MISNYLFFLIARCFLQVAEVTGTDLGQPLSPGIDAKELAQKMSLLSAGVRLACMYFYLPN